MNTIKQRLLQPSTWFGILSLGLGFFTTGTFSAPDVLTVLTSLGLITVDA